MRFSIAVMMISSTVSTALTSTIPTKSFPTHQGFQPERLRTRINSRKYMNRIQSPQFTMNGSLQNMDEPMECWLDHLATEADLGILSPCPPNFYCSASSESQKGGFCLHRQLQDMATTMMFCNPNNRFFDSYESCDCSTFDYISQQGSFVCVIYGSDHCFQENVCGSLTVQRTIGSNETVEYCYDFMTPVPSTVCYTYSVLEVNGNGLIKNDCSIVVDGVPCKSCNASTEELDGLQEGCYEIDCTNNLAGFVGIDCLGGEVVQGLFEGVLASDGTLFPTTTPSSFSSQMTPSYSTNTMSPDSTSQSPTHFNEPSDSPTRRVVSSTPTSLFLAQSSIPSIAPYSSTLIPSENPSRQFLETPSRTPTPVPSMYSSPIPTESNAPSLLYPTVPSSAEPTLDPTSSSREPTNAPKYSLTAAPSVVSKYSLTALPTTSSRYSLTAVPVPIVSSESYHPSELPTTPSTEPPTLTGTTLPVGSSEPTTDQSRTSSVTASSISAAASCARQGITLLLLLVTVASVGIVVW